MNLKGKSAIVTGAGRGIGREICAALADHGVKVAAVDIKDSLLAETAALLQSKGVEVKSLVANVARGEDADKVCDEVAGAWGRIDILVNNAGITRDGLVLRMKDEDWNAVIDVNLKGVFNFTRSAARFMVRERSGRIINIASVSGLMGNAGQANYAASKGGVIALTKTVAKELASRNVTVNAIAPGFISTDMTAALPEEVRKRMLEVIPMRRMGEPKDVARAVIFFAGELADYVTGQVLVVDGGLLM
ncbi:MAG: 3-oxoacyl-[acyl-carrier-protein] reductase [Planctomycetota bacterium]|nr:3-oxoacyl-[acyl-carrier-protein] reductase [Planctomycetota bacterium]